MQPTLVLNIKPDMLLYREESFGPVCTVQRFSSIEEGIALANDSEFGFLLQCLAKYFTSIRSR
jgi:acyl-CoA reductase-like NAD-dependent aldehyde dehydrogenase